VRVVSGAREAQLLEQRRVERLARAPAPSLGGVEDQVRAARFDLFGQARRGARALYLLDSVSARAQSARDGAHRLGAVELGFVLAVRKTQIVCERDAH